MKQRRYTPDEKSEIMLTFIERRKTEGISLRCYAGEIGIPYYTMRDMYRDPRYNAGEIGIPYYTMRDMYRDPRYNPEWDRRYEYSTQDNPSAGKRMKSADSSITFVRIC